MIVVVLATCVVENCTYSRQIVCAVTLVICAISCLNHPLKQLCIFIAAILFTFDIFSVIIPLNAWESQKLGSIELFIGLLYL